MNHNFAEQCRKFVREITFFPHSDKSFGEVLQFFTVSKYL